MLEYVEQIRQVIQEKRYNQREEALRSIADFSSKLASYVSPLLHLERVERLVLQHYLEAQFLAKTPYQRDAGSQMDAAQNISLLREAYTHPQLFTLAVRMFQTVVLHNPKLPSAELVAKLDKLVAQLFREYD